MTTAIPKENGPIAGGWCLVVQSLRRPYRVPLPMILLFALVPLYIFIPELFPPQTRHAPALPLDHALPLVPAWSLVYGALYGFLILLPIVVVRQEEQVRRTVFAYLLAWLTAYVFFIVYPTAAPRPDRVVGEGFAVWGLRALYSADPPYNCFPSLHVAHSFVSALSAGRVHRRLGAVALLCAAIVAASTLFTKQHYVADVLAGVLLALIAHAVFLRGTSIEHTPVLDRQAAPALALLTSGVVLFGLLSYWLVYLWGAETRFDFGP